MFDIDPITFRKLIVNPIAPNQKSDSVALEQNLFGSCYCLQILLTYPILSGHFEMLISKSKTHEKNALVA